MVTGALMFEGFPACIVLMMPMLEKSIYHSSQHTLNTAMGEYYVFDHKHESYEKAETDVDLRMIAFSSSAENVARKTARASGSLRKSRDKSSSAETSSDVLLLAWPFSALL
jgi:hypothetical protein